MAAYAWSLVLLHVHNQRDFHWLQLVAQLKQDHTVFAGVRKSSDDLDKLGVSIVTGDSSPSHPAVFAGAVQPFLLCYHAANRPHQPSGVPEHVLVIARAALA